MLAQINAIAAQTDAFVTSRTSTLANLNARLGELGPAPTPPATEDSNITRQRAALTKQRNAVDSDIRLAKLLAIDAQQRGNDLLRQRRRLFETKLTERAPSPLGSEFWTDLRDAWSGDRDRLDELTDEFRHGVAVVRAAGPPQPPCSSASAPRSPSGRVARQLAGRAGTGPIGAELCCQRGDCGARCW